MGLSWACWKDNKDQNRRDFIGNRYRQLKHKIRLHHSKSLDCTAQIKMKRQKKNVIGKPDHMLNVQAAYHFILFEEGARVTSSTCCDCLEGSGDKMNNLRQVDILDSPAQVEKQSRPCSTNYKGRPSLGTGMSIFFFPYSLLDARRAWVVHCRFFFQFAGLSALCGSRYLC